MKNTVAGRTLAHFSSLTLGLNLCGLDLRTRRRRTLTQMDRFTKQRAAEINDQEGAGA